MDEIRGFEPAVREDLEEPGEGLPLILPDANHLRDVQRRPIPAYPSHRTIDNHGIES